MLGLALHVAACAWSEAFSVEYDAKKQAGHGRAFRAPSKGYGQHGSSSKLEAGVLESQLSGVPAALQRLRVSLACCRQLTLHL